MIKLDDFINMGFRITWTLIEIGFKGSKQFFGQISSDEVINFAINKLEENNEQSEEVILLASENKANHHKIDNLLKKLSRNESCDWDKEIILDIRNIKMVYLCRTLLNLLQLIG